jgi:hypothetical protein
LERAVNDRVPIALGTPWSLSLDDQIIIIQHPLGGFKRYAQDPLSLQYIGEDVIQYLADTQEGSSGSPVFNTRVHCIALHHAEAEVEVSVGDQSKKILRNEGIHIERVMDGLRAADIPFDDDPNAYITRVRNLPRSAAGDRVLSELVRNARDVLMILSRDVCLDRTTLLKQSGLAAEAAAAAVSYLVGLDYARGSETFAVTSKGLKWFYEQPE